MSDRVITVIAREKAINDTEGLGETQDDDISCKITVGSFCSAAFFKMRQFQHDNFFCTENTGAVCSLWGPR